MATRPHGNDLLSSRRVRRPDLIAKARQMTEDVGRRPATVAEARELLGVPRKAAV